MSYLKNLEKFNTHSMSEDVVLSVSTGRDVLISNITKIIDDNLFHPENIQHVVLTGPRGMGKSFLLRYFQIIIKNRDNTDSHIDFALLPEEQHNVNLPSQFIDELLDVQTKTLSKSASWNNKDVNWERSLNKLIGKIEEGLQRYKNYLFIAVVENLDILIDDVFSSDLDQSKLRQLLSETKNFMLFGSSKRCDIDTNYNKRLFFAFQKYSLDPWTEEDYSNYFSKRYDLIKKERPDEFDKKDIGLLRNKLKAISKFTGGSPRMAVVLTNLLFDEDVVTTAQTLNNYVEDLSPYYQDLMKIMPKNSRILFDAMVRSKENISQSELAELVGAKQADISQAFKWLLNSNYIIGSKNKGEKFYRYSVADRVFVLFYNKRFIYQGFEYSYIKILSEFLISFYESRELSTYALKCLEGKNQNEGIQFARLVFDKEKMHYDRINWQKLEDIKNSLYYLVNSNTVSTIEEDKRITKNYNEEFEKNIEPHLISLKKWEAEKNIQEQAKELDQIGLGYKNLTHYEKAIEYHQKALELKEKEGSISGQAWSLGEIGWNYNKLQRYEKAIEYHQKALKLREIEDNISKQADEQAMIGVNYYFLKQYEKAIQCHQKALELRVKEGNISKQAVELKIIGMNYSFLQPYEKAIEYYQKYIELSEKGEDISEQAWVLSQIGWNFKKLKQYEKAIEYHQRAFELREKENNISEQAWNLGQIGWDYYQLQQYEKAIQCHQKALELRAKEGNISKQSDELLSIGVNYTFLQHYEKAFYYYQKALKLSEKEGNISDQTNELALIGVNYSFLQQYEKAIEYHQRAFELSEKENNISEQAMTLTQIGLNYHKLQQYEKAIEYHQRAFELSEKENNISDQAMNLTQIGLNYNELQQYEKTIEYHQRASN